MAVPSLSYPEGVSKTTPFNMQKMTPWRVVNFTIAVKSLEAFENAKLTGDLKFRNDRTLVICHTPFHQEV
ncbi:hypothetical protein QQP08_010499 [Theobroma cacao]|nr:hypothetical protein QQP08_010499 [Theobroma cacao]